jgi:hypothetical protein
MEVGIAKPKPDMLLANVEKEVSYRYFAVEVSRVTREEIRPDGFDRARNILTLAHIRVLVA